MATLGRSSTPGSPNIASRSRTHRRSRSWASQPACTQTAPFRHAAAPGECGATARQPAGHLGKWPNWANALGQPPARLRGTLENGPTGQMRSGNRPPACGAACARVRKSRSGVWPHGKAHSVQPAGSRLRLLVRPRPQTASFRRVRLSSPGQTSNRLTERRTLVPLLTERRILCGCSHTECAFW